MTTWCAAYGSNLDEDDLRAWLEKLGFTCGVPRPVARGWLVDHSLGFRRRSVVRAGGVLDVLPAVGHATPAVLFECSHEHMRALDAKEGTAEGHYARTRARFADESGTVTACTTYQVVHRDPVTAPASAYLDIVRRGYTRHGLDVDVLQRAAHGDEDATRVAWLFTYGTLMRGQRNHREARMAGLEFHASATTTGTLVDLGTYPGLLPGPGGGTVHGEVFRFPEEPARAFQGLDDLEGCREDTPLYQRVPRTVTLADGSRVLACTYVYARDAAAARAVEGGNWRRHRGAVLPLA